MLLSQHFVFVHIPKTGGTWVREILQENAPASWQMQVRFPGHHPASAIPAEYQTAPRLACVRNPWDWYVSLFHFWKTHHTTRTGGFAPPPEHWGAVERQWAKLIADSPTFEPFVRLVMEGSAPWKGLGELLVKMIDAPGPPFEFLRCERLRAELRDWLDKRGLLNRPLDVAIRDSPKKMTSPHDHYVNYYTPQLRELVREREREIVERFEYEF